MVCARFCNDFQGFGDASLSAHFSWKFRTFAQNFHGNSSNFMISGTLSKPLFFKAESARGGQGAFFTKISENWLISLNLAIFSDFSKNSIIS